MKLLRRIRYWLSSRRAAADLAEEIEFHHALKQEELERAGLSRQEAAAASRRQLGNTLLAREESRDVWGWTWIGDTVADIGYAFRTILKMPMLAAVVVISLGIGIGVNTAVFSWVEAMILKPIPGVEASFYLVEPLAETGSYPGASWLEYKDLTESLPSFGELIAFRLLPLNLGEPDRSERRTGALVSDNYFSALGLKPALGHFPQKDEIVISYGFWKARFNRSPDTIGQTLRINDQVLAIGGVVPEGFQGTILALDFDFWLPARLAPSLIPGSRELEERSQRGYSIIGKLRGGATMRQAQADFDAAMRQLAQTYPEASGKFRGEVLPYWRSPRGPQRLLATSVVVLQAIMLVLLAAVCGNTANLLLARAATRGREVGTRLALGATRWRVVRLLMMESLLLGLFSAGLGAVIALWGTDALRAVRIQMAFPIRFQTSIDGTGLAVSALLGILSAVGFGIVPSLHLVRGDLQTKLRSFSTGVPSTRLRQLLMGTEAALALMVLLAAALFFESFRDTRVLDPGFQIEGILLSAYDLRGGSGHLQAAGTIDPAVSRTFADQLLERLRAVPGVESAAIASSVPLDIHGMPMVSFQWPDAAGSSTAPQRALVNFVTPDYFKTMKIPLIAGVGFAPLNDTTLGPQIVVNEEYRRRFLSNREPLGTQVKIGNTVYAVAGVVKNSFYDSFGEAPIPIIYYSFRDRPRPSGEIHVRTHAGNETLLTNDVRRAVRELEPAVPIFNVRTFAEHMETNLILRRIPARLFIVLGPLLLFFAAIGIYSVVAYNVSHRIKEIGVRMALGATAGDVVRQIVKETLKVIAWGALPGVLLTYVVYIHVVRGGKINLIVFLGVPALLLLVAAASSWLPARRSAGIDPMIALRNE
jgi:macrolide transport system ATP-binding/permease protein